MDKQNKKMPHANNHWEEPLFGFQWFKSKVRLWFFFCKKSDSKNRIHIWNT